MLATYTIVSLGLVHESQVRPETDYAVFVVVHGRCVDLEPVSGNILPQTDYYSPCKNRE